MKNILLCDRDPLLKEIREIYSCNPIKVPDSRIKPLSIIIPQKGVPFVFGGLKHILKKGNIDIPIEQSKLANISEKKTLKFDINLGLKILPNFFNAMNISSDLINTNFSSFKYLSLSFNNVRREFIDINYLAKVIKSRELEENPITINYFKEDYPLYLIDSVLQSNSFSLYLEKKNTSDADIVIPTTEIFTDVDIKISVISEKTTSITFTNKKIFLTFGFSAIELEIDKSSKLISQIKPSPNNITKSIEFENSESKDIYDSRRVLFNQNPELLFLDLEGLQ